MSDDRGGFTPVIVYVKGAYGRPRPGMKKGWLHPLFHAGTLSHCYTISAHLQDLGKGTQMTPLASFSHLSILPFERT